jgi:hypothetical protein
MDNAEFSVDFETLSVDRGEVGLVEVIDPSLMLGFEMLDMI